MGPQIARRIQNGPSPVARHGKVEEFVEVNGGFLRVNFSQNHIVFLFGYGAEEGLGKVFDESFGDLADETTDEHFPIISHTYHIVIFWRVFSHVIVYKVGAEQVGTEG